MAFSLRKRIRRLSTPVIVLASLLVSLGLTALGDEEAQAGRSGPRSHNAQGEQDNSSDLRILDWTLWNVSKYYVEPERVDPSRMTMAGLEALEKVLPEVLVERMGDTSKVRVKVGTKEREFSANVGALWAVGPHIREVFHFIESNTELEKKTRQEAEYSVIEGILKTLDPHTNLLRPQALFDMQTHTTGHFGGLGIEVGIRDSVITVLRVLPDNPAEKAGLKAGDRVIQIDNQSTVTMNLNEAVDLMRGPAGTGVALYVRRDGLQKPKKIQITRDIIKLTSVSGTVLPGNEQDDRKVGYIEIPRNFSRTTGRELREKLSSFEQTGVAGVVLDMRNNPGGLLPAAVEVADAFLSSGTIVSTTGSASARDESHADSRYDFPDLPVVVLVNEGSASATEIVAGALKNHDRALVMGRRTFGKGSVQVLHDRKIDDRELAIKLTIAQYLLPGDVSIQSVGVTPDFETQPVYLSEDFIYYFAKERFDRIRESSLSQHLDNAATKKLKEEKPSQTLHFLAREVELSEKGKKKKKRSKQKPIPNRDDPNFLLEDAELRIARDLVLWAPSTNRKKILERLPEFAAEQSLHEHERIADGLKQLGVDWSSAAEDQRPSEENQAKLHVEVTTDHKDAILKGGESGTLTVSVTNKGLSPAYQVRAFGKSDYSHFDERELFFGRIDPGQTKTASTSLSVSEYEHSRKDHIDFKLFEQFDAPITAESKASITISSEGLPRPLFAYGYQILDDPGAKKNKQDEVQGNGDGVLQVGERVRIRVWVKNIGEGNALDTWVHLKNLNGDALFLHSGRAEIGEIKTGDTGAVELDLELKKAPRENQTRLQLTVLDNKIGEYVSEKIELNSDLASLEWSPPVSKHFALKANTKLLSNPAEGSRPIAQTRSEGKLKVSGVSKDWVRVELEDNRFAFVQKHLLNDGVEAKGNADVEDIYSVSPPIIQLANAVNHTDSDRVHLSGVARDNEALQDIYITVRNPSWDFFGSAEKVFYQASQNPKAGELPFAADVPLHPGNNFIEIHARQNDDVQAIKQMWVLRNSGERKTGSSTK